MGITVQCLCENCSTLLKGRKGNTFIVKPRLQIKGTILQQHVDPETEHESWTYLTSKPNSDLEFCDDACFSEWCATQLMLAENRKKRHLRDVAAGQALDRLDPSMYG